VSKGEHYGEGWVCMRAPFAGKDGLLVSVFREWLFPTNGVPGPWTTFKIRRYDDRFELFAGFSKKSCKTIAFGQISYYETAKFPNNFSALKSICYMDAGKKIKIDTLPMYTDCFAVYLRRHMPEKEKIVSL